MPKDGRLPAAREHPPWCQWEELAPEDHDPHTSHRERVQADYPSQIQIEAYLIQLDRVETPGPLVQIEVTEPGEEMASHLLTFGQLRDLSTVLSRLMLLGRTTEWARADRKRRN